MNVWHLMPPSCLFAYNKYILPCFKKNGYSVLKKMTYIYSLQENLIAMFVSDLQIKKN